jgi:hypothetical protein
MGNAICLSFLNENEWSKAFAKKEKYYSCLWLGNLELQIIFIEFLLAPLFS